MPDEEKQTIEKRLEALEALVEKQSEGIETLLKLLESGKALFKLGEWAMAAIKPTVAVIASCLSIYSWWRDK